MVDCCADPYDNTFDSVRAERELKTYRASGPKKSSQLLIDLLIEQELASMSLLDIGGGVGVVVFELFKAGIERAVQVDLSQAYIQQARSEAGRQNLTDRIQYVCGDFLDRGPGLESADIVTLDKVICCYEAYEPLIEQSIRKAKRWYGFIVPRETWWVRLFHGIGEWKKRLLGNRFRTFIHPISEIEDSIYAAGFTRVAVRTRREWYIGLYERTERNS